MLLLLLQLLVGSELVGFPLDGLYEGVSHPVFTPAYRVKISRHRDGPETSRLLEVTLDVGKEFLSRHFVSLKTLKVGDHLILLSHFLSQITDRFLQADHLGFSLLELFQKLRLNFEKTALLLLHPLQPGVQPNIDVKVILKKNC